MAARKTPASASSAAVRRPSAEREVTSSDSASGGDGPAEDRPAQAREDTEKATTEAQAKAADLGDGDPRKAKGDGPMFDGRPVPPSS